MSRIKVLIAIVLLFILIAVLTYFKFLVGNHSVMINVLDYQIEIRLDVMVYALLLSLVLINSLLFIVKKIILLPRTINNKFRCLSQDAHTANLEKYIMNYYSKDEAGIEHYSRKIINRNGNKQEPSILNFMIELELRLNQKKYDMAKATIFQIRNRDFMAKKYIMSKLLFIYVQENNQELAVETAIKLLKVSPSDDYAYNFLYKRYIDNKQWYELRELISGGLKKIGFAGRSSFLLAICHYLESKDYFDKELLDSAYLHIQQANKLYGKFPPIVVLYMQTVKKQNIVSDKLNKIFIKCWRSSPSMELINAFLDLHAEASYKNKVKYVHYIANNSQNVFMNKLLQVKVYLAENKLEICHSILFDLAKDYQIDIKKYKQILDSNTKQNTELFKYILLDMVHSVVGGMKFYTCSCGVKVNIWQPFCSVCNDFASYNYQNVL